MQLLPHPATGAEEEQAMAFLTSVQPSSLHKALEGLMYDLDTLGLVIGQLLFSTVVNRGTVFKFSAENWIKYFLLCTCL